MNYKKPAAYIMANKYKGTIYIGVTSDLNKRVYQHQSGQIKGFTKRYGCKMLVYYELYECIIDAINREKQLKAGSRNKKIELIESVNVKWLDLSETLL